MRCTAIIVAAGSGRRMGTATRKQFLLLHDKPVAALAIEKFQLCPHIDDIIVVTAKESISYVESEIVGRYGFSKVSRVIAGGKERQDSVYEGLKAAEGRSGIAAIHDAVRPFVTVGDISKIIEETKIHRACVMAVRAKDTIKVSDGEGFIKKTPDRSQLWLAQTPQAFDFDLICGAFQKAFEEGFRGTDDASVAERYGIPVKLVEGSYDNIKLTTKEDLVLGEAIYREGQV